MSVITKDLGVATAYGYAKSKGYTGTEEEFAELMASYADVAQQAEAAAQDAEDAKDAAITAKTAAQTAQTAAESAQTAAAGSAQTASTKASEASNSAQTAAGSATAAGNSATAAAGSASTAQTAAQTATTKASEASSSASAASTAKTGAETARTGAQTAQTAAETAQANAEAAASSVSASAAQIEQNTEEIGAIKNDLNQFPNGTYPNMSVGNADQLTATVGIEDKTPYLFRTSGGSVDIGDREDVRKITGVSIPWNQPAKEINSTNWQAETNVTATFENGIGSFTSSTVNYGIKCSTGVPVQGGHVYFGCATIKAVSECSVRCFFGSNGGAPFDITATASFVQHAKVVKASSGANGSSLYVFPVSNTGSNVLIDVKDIIFTDLTQDFGTSIADYVYSLETATAGAGVAWLKKYFPKQFDSGYQAYDAGSLQSVSGLTVHKMVGFNQWNEQWEVGAYTASGAPSAVNDRIRSANMIPVLPNTAYYFSTGSTTYFVTKLFFDADRNPLQTTLDQYQGNSNTPFTTPNDAHFMLWYGAAAYGATYNHDICINLSWDGEKDGTYEPYKTWSYALDDSVVIRGIPKVDANGNLYYDGDEYLPDGTVNRRYGIVDLGTLSWDYLELSGNSCFVNYDLPNMKYGTVNNYKPNMVVNGFIVCSRDDLTHVIGYDAITNNVVGHLIVSTTKYGTDAAAFKTAMSGVYLVYELATPTTETADPYQATQIVDDWGTEEYVLADGAFPVPVGHETYYQNNLRAKLEMSPDSPDGDGLYVVQQESGENTYVPLASTATIQDILARLTALENA